jgi:putative tricarboxylic transport membrane protein
VTPMQRAMDRDRLAGGVLVVVALVALWESTKLPLGSLKVPGPGFMPAVLALVLLGGGVVLVSVGRGAPATDRAGIQEWRHAVAIFAACAFAAWSLERLGYRLTIVTVLLFVLTLVERKRILGSLAFALALAFGSYFLFNTLLRVPLPRGPAGI